MAESARLAPPNSIVIIEDISGGEVPDLMEGTCIAATATCVTVSTLCEIDGETEFRLGTRFEVDPGTPPIFQGRLKTPSRTLVIRSVPITLGAVLGDIVLETPVPLTETMISIWVNHPKEPDQIIVGVE